VFFAKTAELLEKKRVELFAQCKECKRMQKSAKECRRVQKSVKQKEIVMREER
jgi:hypothetical protein